MNTRQVTSLAMAALTLSLVACGNLSTRDKNTVTGAAIGGVAGAVLTGGSTAGTVGGAVVGGVAGAVLTGGSTAGTVGGAVVGGVIGNKVDPKDKK